MSLNGERNLLRYCAIIGGESVKNICEKDKCSGCNACLNVCGKNAVKRVMTVRGEEVNVIDEECCVECGLCKKVCPQNSESFLNAPKFCFAAWSVNNCTRAKSASGGVATELYKWAIKHDMWISRVRMTDDLFAEHYFTKDFEALSDFQNSKYVYSDTKYVFNQISKKLMNDESALFVGLPCQCDALKAVCNVEHISTKKLYIIDLVCHGTAPQTYLKEHVSAIELKKKKKADKLFFRDPDTDTYTYTFTLKNKGKPFYRKRIDRNDYYQIGYHKGIIYRENCYSCKYAQQNRTGDLTLADFSYVGMEAPCSYDNKNVSCVLVNTGKGKELLNEVAKEYQVYIEERPMQEEMKYEHMLHAPTAKPQERVLFEKSYVEDQVEFEEAMRTACRNIALKNELRYYLHVRDLKRSISRMVPSKLKIALRKK